MAKVKRAKNNNITAVANNKDTRPLIIIFCAHNDDQVLGIGGTIKKYILKGYRVETYIFSYGETSHPHLKPSVIIKIRLKEAQEAAAVLGDTIHFFGISENKFEEQFDITLLTKIISEKKPEKIFTHSQKDQHPDHKAVFRLTMKSIQKTRYEGELYVFDIWNMFTFWDAEHPKLFIDVSDTFKHKMEAFSKHSSQVNTIMTLWWSVYLKAKLHGLANKCKYAELFHKIDFKENTK